MRVDEPGCWPAEPRLLDAFDAAVFVVDTAGRVRHANATAERRYGLPGGGLVGEQLLTHLFTATEQTPMAAVVGDVLGGRPWSGQLQVRQGDESLEQAAVGCSPLWQGDEVVGLLYVVDDVASLPGDPREARRLAERLTRLARVTTELIMAESVESVTKIVISHAADAVGATVASLTLREADDQLRMVGLRGGREGDEEQWGRYPMSTRTPTSDSIRTGLPVMLTGGNAIRERYPEHPGMDRGERSVISLPLHVSTRTIGAIGLSFPGLRTLDAAELDFFEILADTCAQAFERIEAKEVAARQSAKLAFLAEAATELASSLDYQGTLARVARLAVPTFADWCAIDVVVDGRLHRVAVEHVDPAKVRLAREIAERYPSDPDALHGAWHVMRTGQAELLPEISDEMLTAAARDEEHLRLALDLHLRSAITVPLIARDRVLGVITWVMAESERLYTHHDLALAEDLAKRAAIAIDNAELHSDTLATSVQLQHAVLPEVLPVVPGWEVASHYSPSGRTEVGGDFYDVVRLGDGRIALFVGDVMGRGVAAAAAMAQMRAAVRAYVAIDPTPEVVMTNLDRMYQQYPTEQLVTLVYLVVDPARDELVVTNAGHPAPVLLRADLSAEELPIADGCPLGVLAEERHQTTVPFRAGDTILAYTDGLIERRDEDITDGQDRLRATMRTLAGPDLAGAVEEFVALLRDDSRDDDVAVLAARRTT